MIVTRDVFHLKFGMAREAKGLLSDGKKIMEKNGYKIDRILTDLTGKSYRLIMEIRFESLAEYEKALKSTLSADEWKRWYEKFIPLVDSSEREILNVVEI